MHGGTVEAVSDGHGQGSEFVVRLPLAAAPPAAEESSRPRTQAVASDNRSGKLRILVVDDNHDAASMLARLLGALGHEVRVAHDGPEALAECQTFCPQAVLLDIGLPGMNGYEVARQIRKMPHRAGVLLVAQTGWGQGEDKRQSEAAGFDAHLVKPIEMGALRPLLAKAQAPGQAPA